MGWRTVVDMASLLGGVFALIAMWLYLKPTVIVTIETYEYVPGTGNRRFRLVVRNTGNVPVRLLRFDQEFQDNTPPGSWTDLSPMFVGRDGRTWRDLPPSAEIPVWLNEAGINRRTGFAVVYRGRHSAWLPWNLRASARFDVRDYGVVYNVSLTATAVGSAQIQAVVIRGEKPTSGPSGD